MEDEKFKRELDNYLTQSDEDAMIRRYNGFEIDDTHDEKKLMALIDALDLNTADHRIEELDNGNFVINPRKERVGETPVMINRSIQALEKLLTKKQLEELRDFVKKNGYDSKFETRASEKTHDKLYNKLKKRLHSKEDSDEYRYLVKEHLHAENLLYHLMSAGDSQYEKQVQRALFHFKVEDLSRLVDRNDGEYMVLTEDEADDKAIEYLEDGDYWQMAVENGDTEESKQDYIESILDIDGRGSVLASYDGDELEAEIDGKTYYVYRVD